MRIIMMGTGPFAVPTFRWLLESPHDVLVVTRPSPPARGRGRVPVNPMREVAESAGLEVLAPADINDRAVRRQLQMLRPDLFVVCDYGQILSGDTLAVAPLGGINLHGSLLPKYRGAAPVQWAIIRGESETGTTVIHMTPRLDAGPTLVQHRTKIGADETADELEQRLAEMGVGSVQQALAMLDAWDRSSSIGQPQDSAHASRAPRLRKADGEIDWNQSARDIHNRVRGLTPWPGTFTHWQRNGKRERLILDRVRPELGSVADSPPGTVTACDEQHVLVATSDGLLAIESVQPPGKRVLTAAEFLRGYAVAEGTRFESKS